MSVISTVDGVSVRVYGTKSESGQVVEKSMALGTMNATRYQDNKMMNIVNAMKPVVDIDITKAKKTIDSFLSVSE